MGWRDEPQGDTLLVAVLTDGLSHPVGWFLRLFGRMNR